MIGEIITWFSVLLQPTVMLYLIAGFLLGITFGTIPGLTSTLAVALLLPLTFGMEPLPALIMVVGIYGAGIWSSSITAHVINIPGAPGGAIAGYEGFQLTKQGKLLPALRIDLFASMYGGLVGGLLLLLFIGPIADVALLFRSPERFSLVFLSLVITSLLYADSVSKGVVATIVGMILASIGLDSTTQAMRATFGITELSRGIDLLVIVVAVFVVAEILLQIDRGFDLSGTMDELKGVKIRDFIPNRGDLKGIRPRIAVESPILGMITGILPGAGATMASIVTYGEANRISSEPEKYGKGSREGIFAAESGNNAMCPGAVVPLIVFGIPGDAVTAVILGVFLIHGINPNPELVASSPDIIGPMIAAFTVIPILFLAGQLFVGPLLIKIYRLNLAWVYSFIAVISIVGVYAVTFSQSQLYLTVIVGVIAFLLAREGYPRIPLIMGFILGPLLERYLRASMQLSNNDPSIFLIRPVSLVLLVLSLVFIVTLTRRDFNTPD